MHIVRLLVNAFSNNGMNSETLSCTPLITATRVGNELAVEALLQNGASPHVREADSQWTPLHCAAMYGDVDIVRRLIDAGANVDSASALGETALHVATASANVAVVDTLLRAGADANASSDKGYRPLHRLLDNFGLCDSHGTNLSVLRLLIAAGADVNAVDAFGRTPTYGGVQSMDDSWKVNRQMLRALVDAGVRLDIEIPPEFQSDSSMPTIAHYASVNDDFELLNTYISQRGDLNVVGPLHGTALHVVLTSSFSCASVHTVEVLQRHGARALDHNLHTVHVADIKEDMRNTYRAGCLLILVILILSFPCVFICRWTLRGHSSYVHAGDFSL